MFPYVCLASLVIFWEPGWFPLTRFRYFFTKFLTRFVNVNFNFNSSGKWNLVQKPVQIQQI